MKKMTKQELIKKLKDCGKINDNEGAHIEADELLLRYINDNAVIKVWNKISSDFWYA